MSYHQAIKKAMRRSRYDRLAAFFFAVLMVILIGSAVMHAFSPLPENVVESAFILGMTFCLLSLACFLISNNT